MTPRGPLVCLALLVSSAQAQTHRWTLDGPAFSTPAATLQTAAAAIPTQPSADVTILFEQEHYTLTADGRLTSQHTLLYRIDTKAGAEDWNHTSLQWDPWYQSQPTLRARVILPDGRVSELDPKTITDVPAKNEQDDTFSDARIHKAPLPSISVGAIVEEETTLTDKQAFFAGGSAYRIYFSRNVPILRARAIVEVPTGSPFQIRPHLLPQSAAQTTETAGIRRTVYDLDDVPLSTPSDIDLPTDESVYPFVEFSTGPSWSAVTTAYAALAEPQIQPEAIRSLLPAPAPITLAQIQSIVSRLHKEIRYTGIEFGESAIKPQNPAEVLKRHYGDCKDKAAFLVAMLRASGVPANLALLQTGPGPDVNPDLPGMNQFDHAIVHVPAGATWPELWIDATAEFTHVGDLPYQDQGRRALIIAGDTTALTLTPQPKPSDSLLVETREVFLNQFGPAHIVESSSTTGQVDSEYRARYGSAETKAVRDGLEKYARNVYLAKTLTRYDHGDGADLTKPFVLALDMDQAKRGNSSVIDAAIGIRVASLMSRLPNWFYNDPLPPGTKRTPIQEEDQKKAEAHRRSSYLIQPFNTEWRYRITLPDGFAPHALPEDQTLHFGPALLTRHFIAEPEVPGHPRLVTATFHFDSVKPRYTVEEVLALRQAVLEADRQNLLILQFDQVGASLYAEGKIRQSFITQRALIAAHPTVAMHHVQLSRGLLTAGLGEQAQAEARLAVSLDPKSAIAAYWLGWSLEHNAIGVQHGRGFDRKGALDSYRKAIALDPENIDYVIQLAILYEYNDKGERYADDASMPAAIKAYRSLEAIDKDAFDRYHDSILFDLLYSHQFAELSAELKPLPSSPTRDAMAVTAVAASTSIPAAITRAGLITEAAQRSAALRLAGVELMRLNLYPQSAAMLDAGSQGQAESAQIAHQVEIFRDLKHIAATPPYVATEPAAPVRLVLSSMMNGTMGENVSRYLSRHSAATDAEWKKIVAHNEESNVIEVIAAQAGLPQSVMRDLILGQAKVVSDGDDAHGFRVSMQMAGAEPESFFVGKEEAGYKIAAQSTDDAEIGNYAMYLVGLHRDAEAHALLDWKREFVHRGGGDDPMEGPFFPRFWTTGTVANPQTDPAAIQIAALALSLSKPDSQIPLTAALAADKTAPTADLALLLAWAYLNHNDPAAARPYADRLLTQYPESNTVLGVATAVYARQKDYKTWSTLLAGRLAKRPADPDLLRDASNEAQAEADFPRGRKSIQQLIDNGKATSNDYNNNSWSTLFDDHVDAKAIEQAQQANSLTKNGNFGDIHTLACLYAVQGKTAEARDLLLKSMAAANLAEPNSAVWLGFGLIYEQLGAEDAAVTAYKKVKEPDQLPASPTDSYTLAQAHLKKLHAS